METDISDDVIADGMGSSDHATIRRSIHTEAPDLPKKKTHNLYDKRNYTKMNEMLYLNWEELIAHKTIEEVILLEHTYYEAAKLYVRKERKPLWITKDAMKKIKNA